VAASKRTAAGALTSQHWRRPTLQPTTRTEPDRKTRQQQRRQSASAAELPPNAADDDQAGDNFDRSTSDGDGEMATVATATHLNGKRLVDGGGNQLGGVLGGGCSGNNKANGETKSSTSTGALHQMTTTMTTATTSVKTPKSPSVPAPNVGGGQQTSDDDYSPNHVVYKKVSQRLDGVVVQLARKY
jgi:hypothetical protein